MRRLRPDHSCPLLMLRHRYGMNAVKCDWNKAQELLDGLIKAGAAASGDPEGREPGAQTVRALLELDRAEWDPTLPR